MSILLTICTEISDILVGQLGGTFTPGFYHSKKIPSEIKSVNCTGFDILVKQANQPCCSCLQNGVQVASLPDAQTEDAVTGR